MINRVLIRIRVVQIAYAFSQNDEHNLKKAETELMHCLEKSYELYFHLLALLVEVTNAYKKRITQRKSRFLATSEDINPNLKLANNRFIALLSESVHLKEFLEEKEFTWEDHDIYVRNLLDRILDSNFYSDYARQPEDSFENDRDFWKQIFKHIICEDADLNELLEDESLYWNDDVEIVESFVLKTIKKSTEGLADTELFLPMFKDMEDKDFAKQLLSYTIKNNQELEEIIDQHTQNWESERVALMDMVIMEIAVSELLAFPKIPVNVTLNEYIDIVKAYSTAKSAGFINGVLDAIVQSLKKENRLNKA